MSAPTMRWTPERLRALAACIDDGISGTAEGVAELVRALPAEVVRSAIEVGTPSNDDADRVARSWFALAAVHGRR